MKYLRKIAFVLALLLAVSLCGCSLVDKLRGDKKESSEAPDAFEGEDLDPEYPIEAGGVRLLSRPSRVVSLAPALTEKLFDLGMDDCLVGASDYCDYPGSARDLTPCGTAQIPDVEVIEALSPHLVLTEAELPEEAAEQLAALDIPVAVFPRAESVAQLMDNYVDLARLLEGETLGSLIGGAVADEYRERLNDLLRSISSHIDESQRKNALYLRLLDFTVATGDTFEQELLEHLCLDNIAAAYRDWEYPEEEAKSPEGQAAFSSIDVIFMDENFVTITDLEQNAFYKGLPATTQDRYFYISSIVIERQSIRTLEQLERMAAYLYPDIPLDLDDDFDDFHDSDDDDDFDDSDDDGDFDAEDDE